MSVIKGRSLSHTMHFDWWPPTDAHLHQGSCRLYIWNHATFSTQCDQFENILAVILLVVLHGVPTKRGLHIYFEHMAHDDTSERTFSPQTYQTLNYSHVHAWRRHHFKIKNTKYDLIHQDIPPERVCSWNSFDRLFMGQHYVFMFLFLYLFLICSIQFLKKWIWGNWRSCTKCSKKTKKQKKNWLKWSKMPTCSDWL